MVAHGYSAGDSLGVTAEMRLQYGAGLKIAGFRANMHVFTAARVRGGITTGNQKKKCPGTLFDIEANFGYEAGVQWLVPIAVRFIDYLSGTIDFLGGPFVPINLGYICGPLWPKWLPHHHGGGSSSSSSSSLVPSASSLSPTPTPHRWPKWLPHHHGGGSSATSSSSSSSSSSLTPSGSSLQPTPHT
jgi:hypothetical protein